MGAGKICVVLCGGVLPLVCGFSGSAMPCATSVCGGSILSARLVNMRKESRAGITRITAASGSADTEVLPALKDTPPLRIGLMVEPTPFTHVSGYSNRYKEMLTYLSAAGDKIEIVATDDSENPPTDFQGYPIEYTNGFRFALYPVISMSIDYQLKGMQMIQRFKPDIIHVTTPGFMVLICGLYAKLFGIPLIMTYHTHLPVYARNYLGWVPFILPITWFTVRYIHSHADLVLVTSPQLKEEFEEQGIKNVDVWRKGIDTISFNPKYKNAETRKMLSDGNPDDFLIVYIGRLGKEKRIEDLRAVLDRNPSVRLAIVGGGPYMDSLKETFKGTKTKFTGILRGQALWEAFASADVFVMPSDSETLGFVVLESLASGVPVIGVRAGGIPDLIDEREESRTGYLVPVGDVDAISDCLKELMGDTEMRLAMGRRGRAQAELWSWEKATAVLRNVQYRKAIERYQAVTSKRSPVLKLLDGLVYGFVGFMASTLVGFGSTAQNTFNALAAKLKPDSQRNA